MEVAAKTDGGQNGGPLPQRPQKNLQNQGNKNKPNLVAAKQPIVGSEGEPAEKKPRFNQGAPNANVPNQNKGFVNKNFPNRNRGNRGGNPNRGHFQNQNQQNQPNPQSAQPNQNTPNVMKPPPQAVANKEAGGVGPPQQQNKQQNQNQPQQNKQPNPQQQNQQNQNQQHTMNQQHNQNQQHNRGGNRGGGGGGGGAGGGGLGGIGNRDRSRGGGRGAGGGNQGGGNFNSRSDEFFIGQRLRAISGPTHELPPVEATEESKFSGRNRLYVGNLTSDVTEEDLREMFKPYGEIGEIFSNSEKNFTFLKVDYHVNAERAKRELDGTARRGRVLRVRFAPNATILRVQNLTPFVSNELLYKAFEIFGPIERSNIVVDDRGKSTGEGVVEFVKKSSANACLRYCSEKCFFLTASLRPCVVEPFEVNDDADGLPEKGLNKKTIEFQNERNVGPRFAEPGSFEHEYGTRWKQLRELYKTKHDALKRELRMEEEKLEAQMEYARYEHETELLRQELRKRESDNERKKVEWEMREKQAEDMRKRDEENMHRQQSEMQSRMLRQEEEMRRRQQENTLFMQAQQLNSLLDQQEGGGNSVGGFGGNSNNNFDNFGGASNSPFDFRGNNTGAGGGSSGPNNGSNNPQEPFAFEFGGNNQSQGGVGQGNQRGNSGGNNNNNPWERRRRF